jgi:hypothetical protein
MKVSKLVVVFVNAFILIAQNEIQNPALMLKRLLQAFGLVD